MKKIYDDREEPPPVQSDEEEDSEGWKAEKLSAHPNFENAHVNLEKSAVHVPINVYEVFHLLFKTKYKNS